MSSSDETGAPGTTPSTESVSAVDTRAARPSEPVNSAPVTGAPFTSAPVTSAEIEDLIANPNMPLAERQARLRELAERMGVDREETDAEFDPLQTQVNEALNMLAGGGHAYAAPTESVTATTDDFDERGADEPRRKP